MHDLNLEDGVDIRGTPVSAQKRMSVMSRGRRDQRVIERAATNTTIDGPPKRRPRGVVGKHEPASWEALLKPIEHR